MGQTRKTQAYPEETVSDFGTRLKKLQSDINRRLAAMDTDPLSSFTRRTVTGGKTNALPAGFARYRAKNGG